MDSKDAMTIPCPKCGALIKADKWKMIDFGIDPDLRNQLLNCHLSMSSSVRPFQIFPVSPSRASQQNTRPASALFPTILLLKRPARIFLKAQVADWSFWSTGSYFRPFPLLPRSLFSNFPIFQFQTVDLFKFSCVMCNNNGIMRQSDSGNQEIIRTYRRTLGIEFCPYPTVYFRRANHQKEGIHSLKKDGARDACFLFSGHCCMLRTRVRL